MQQGKNNARQLSQLVATALQNKIVIWFLYTRWNMANRKRSNQIIFRLNDEEKQFLLERVEKGGYRNTEAFLRKMALEGLNVKVGVDMSDVREIAKLISNASYNINQITRRTNETKSVYHEDVRELEREITGIRNQVMELSVLIVKRLGEQADDLRDYLIIMDEQHVIK